MTNQFLDSAWLARTRLRMERLFTPGTVLVFTDKHTTRYFAAGSVDEAGAACAHILRERWAQGYWYGNGRVGTPGSYSDPHYEPDTPPEHPGDEVEQLAKRDDNSYITRQLRKQWGDYSRELNQWTEDVAWREAARLVVDGLASPELAYSLLKHRADYEYEGFEVEKLEAV